MQEAETESALEDSSDSISTYRTALRTAKESLFHLFYLSCPISNIEHRYHNSRSALLLCVLLLALRTLQVLSLIYPVQQVMSEWEQYRLWTTIVSFFRFDAAAAILGFQSAFYYFAVAITILPSALYAVIVRKLTKKPKRSWNTLRFLFNLSIQVQAGPLYLPLLCAFLASVKCLSAQTLPEYNDKHAALLPSPVLHYVSVCWGALLVVSSCAAHMFIYDIFLVNAKQHHTARAHSKIEVMGIICQTIAAISHFYLHSTAFLIHYCLCAVLFGFMAFQYAYYLPFYTLNMNWLNALSYFVGAWGSIALIISYAVESAASGFILTVLLPVAVSPVLWDIITRRVAYIKRSYRGSFISLRNCYLGELCIRFHVIDYLEQNSSKLNTQMTEFYNNSLAPLFNRHTAAFPLNMFPSLWEFAIIYSVAHDTNIARVKLTKSAQCPFDLEGQFNQYRFQQLLSEDIKQASEEATYVSFRIQFDAAKKADEESCILQSQFWSELTADHLQPKRAEALAYRVNASLQRSRTLLAKLVQNYPKSHIALRLYGTYLTEVLNDTEHGRELINRSMYEESELNARKQQNESRVSYFDDSNGILLVSGSQATVGSITYINEQAAEILSVPHRLALGMNISTFIPACLCSTKKHDSALLHYLKYCTGDIIHMPLGFFFQDFTEYLIEVRIHMKPTSLDLRPYFLAAMRREAIVSRELCLIDSRGIVQSHSRGFPVLVGYCDTPMLCKGLSADILITNYSVSVSLKPANEVFAYTLPGTINQISMQFASVELGAVTFRVLYATSRPEEIDKWLGKDPETPSNAFFKGETFGGNKAKILKSILRKSVHEILRRELKFDLIPQIFILTETDFPPGHSEYGKQKDASPIDPKHAIKHAEDQPSPNTPNPQEHSKANGAIFDLRDLDDFMRSAKSETPLELQSKVSGAILSELADGKPRGQSLASSAVSSNSSFTSTKTAMDLLKVVNTSMKRFKYSFLFTNLAVISGVTAMLIYLIVSADKYQSRIIVTELSDRRDLVSLLAFDARNLLLVNNGFFPVSQEPLIRTRMTASLSRFDEILQTLTDLLPSFSS